MKKYFCRALPALLILLLPGCVNKIKISTYANANKEVIPTGFLKGQSFTLVAHDNSDRTVDEAITEKLTTTLYKMGFDTSESEISNFHLYYSYGKTSKLEIIEVPEYTRTYGSSYAYGIGCVNHNLTSVRYVRRLATVFTHTVKLQVYRITPFLMSKKKELVWKGTVQCREFSGDFDHIIDNLLKAIFKRFGKDTQKTITEKYTRPSLKKHSKTKLD